MKKYVPYWQIGGFIFTAVAGTVLHFLFDWTDGNGIVALFSAVNESIWEHMKLLFYPMVAFAVVESFCCGEKVKAFWCIKLLGILMGLVLIPVVYYTYTGILGVQVDWFNIAIFFLAALWVYWVETKLLLKEFRCPLRPGIAFFLILLMAGIFMRLTFVPPQIPLFQDPVTGSYGFMP